MCALSGSLVLSSISYGLALASGADIDADLMLAGVIDVVL
jgi:hypothetical protein